MNKQTDNSAVDLTRKFSKEEINELPRKSYTGEVHVVSSERYLLRAVDELSSESLLGFDTETRPSFKKGESFDPALLQLAGSNAVYIFQLKSTGLTSELIELLENTKIIKAGVAIDRDLKELRQLKEFEPGGFVELADISRNCDIQHHGLRGLTALLLGFRISKGARLTNWDRPKLSRSAITYAATDAWVGREIYLKMKELGCMKKKAKQPKNAELKPDVRNLIELAEYRMPFGKHKGKLLIDLPEPYVVWFKNKGLPSGKLGRLLAEIYEIKVNGLEHLFDPLRRK